MAQVRFMGEATEHRKRVEKSRRVIEQARKLIGDSKAREVRKKTSERREKLVQLIAEKMEELRDLRRELAQIDSDSGK